MVYAVMYRQQASHDWVFQYWVTPGDPDKIVRSCQGLLSSEHSSGNNRCQVGYIACIDESTTSDQLAGLRPSIVRYDRDYATKNAPPESEAPLFDVPAVAVEDVEVVEVDAVVDVEPKADDDEDIF
jgi:hypothetical protein